MVTIKQSNYTLTRTNALFVKLSITFMYTANPLIINLQELHDSNNQLFFEETSFMVDNE